MEKAHNYVTNKHKYKQMPTISCIDRCSGYGVQSNPVGEARLPLVTLRGKMCPLCIYCHILLHLYLYVVVVVVSLIDAHSFPKTQYEWMLFEFSTIYGTLISQLYV